jgi:hypothetical protein
LAKKNVFKTPPNIDWVIHFVANDTACNYCGATEEQFPEYICDAHTHGMDKYNHPEFQIVLNYGMQEVGRILNEMGLRVQAGEKFKDGDAVEQIYEDCNVYIFETTDCDGKNILRILIPDKENKMPTESVEPYSLQILSTESLYNI